MSENHHDLDKQLGCSTDYQQFLNNYSMPPSSTQSPTPLPDGVNSPAQPGKGPDYEMGPSPHNFKDMDPPRTMT